MECGVGLGVGWGSMKWALLSGGRMIPNFGMKGMLDLGRSGKEVIPVIIPVWEGWRELILFGHIGFGFCGFGFVIRLSWFYVGHVYDRLMRILYDFRDCLTLDGCDLGDRQPDEEKYGRGGKVMWRRPGDCSTGLSESGRSIIQCMVLMHFTTVDLRVISSVMRWHA